MTINFNVTKVQIVESTGTDSVFLTTDSPCPFVPEYGIFQPLILSFRTTKGFAEEYIKNNFPGITVEIIKIPNGL